MSREVNALVKRIMGRGWNARDPDKVWAWVEAVVAELPERERVVFEDAVLLDRDFEEIAERLGLMPRTVGDRLSKAFKRLGDEAEKLTADQRDEMFWSVYEYEFPEEVRTKDLTFCLFGRYERRSTQAIAVRLIPRVREGKVDLPMPSKRGGSWVWTREQAERWRDWYAGSTKELDVDG